MNIVILSGRISSDPRCTELPSGELRWSIDVTTPAEALAATGRAGTGRAGTGRAAQAGVARAALSVTATVPIAWHGPLPVGEWAAGTEVCVAGSVRRRFFRVGGLTQSRTEVIAHSLVRVAARGSTATALRRVLRALDDDEVARLRSVLPGHP